MRRSAWSTALRSRQGSQALVEFGIVVVAFVPMLLGMLDLGLMLNGWMTVNAGAREAARAGAAGGYVDTAVFAAARRYTPPGVRSSDLKITADYCDQSGASCTSYYSSGSVNPPAPDPSTVRSGYSLTVTVVADTFEVITPLVRPMFGCDGGKPNCPVTLIGKATMRYEGPPSS